MKKFTFLLLMICVIVTAHSQTYQISFAGTGASSKVDSVNVENLTQCKTITLKGSDILDINGTVEINEISNSTDDILRIYPNPMTGYCLFDFEATAQGETTLELYDITGKRISQVQDFLTKGQQTFSLSGIGGGIYVLKVESNQYYYSAKIVSTDLISGIAEIKHIEKVPTNSSNTGYMKSLKRNKSYVVMPYTTGNILKLTGISGIYSTVFMLIPDTSQTVTFNFTACTDGDKNNYAVVQISTQTWMEENLKTTKYDDGTSIPNVTANTSWVNLTHIAAIHL